MELSILYGWVMSQTLPVNYFKWVEYISQFVKSFVKSYNKESDEGYFLEVDIPYPENLHNLHNDLLLLPERMKIVKARNLMANLKLKMLFT